MGWQETKVADLIVGTRMLTIDEFTAPVLKTIDRVDRHLTFTRVHYEGGGSARLDAASEVWARLPDPS